MWLDLNCMEKYVSIVLLIILLNNVNTSVNLISRHPFHHILHDFNIFVYGYSTTVWCVCVCVCVRVHVHFHNQSVSPKCILCLET